MRKRCDYSNRRRLFGRRVPAVLLILVFLTMSIAPQTAMATDDVENSSGGGVLIDETQSDADEDADEDANADEDSFDEDADLIEALVSADFTLSDFEISGSTLKERIVKERG